MKNTELRIGNLTDKGVIKNLLERDIHIGYGKCFKYADVRPITLTEEWLLKFGFSCHWDDDYENHVFSLIRDGLHDDFIIEPSWVTHDKCEGFTVVHCDFQLHIDVEYIHQLQNLYFALTGEELTIK